MSWQEITLHSIYCFTEGFLKIIYFIDVHLFIINIYYHMLRQYVWFFKYIFVHKVHLAASLAYPPTKV